jgi:ribosomal protein S10
LLEVVVEVLEQVEQEEEVLEDLEIHTHQRLLEVEQHLKQL